MRKVLSGVVVLLLAAGLVACGDDDDDSGSEASEGEENTVQVTASGTAFDPTTATATAGEVYFEVTNEDAFEHTFTIDDADVDIHLDANGSGEAEADLEAGTYEWRCTIHSSMKGTLTVS
jgi:plastocyanin